MPEPNWDLDVEQKALIIVDMQNAFCDKDGFMMKIGLNVDQCMAAVEPTKRVLTRCRELDIPVIFTRFWLRPDYKDAGLFEELFPGSHQVQAMVGGTWDSEITPDLEPIEGEYAAAQPRDTIQSPRSLPSTMHRATILAERSRSSSSHVTSRPKV